MTEVQHDHDRQGASAAPLIAVVLPTFNRAAELPRAIDSVLNQTFGGFELIVVDDGSTDATPAVLADRAELRLRTVRQPNSGRCAARNMGVAHATAPFVTFIDSDDEAYPEWLECFAHLIETTGADLVSVGAEFVSPLGNSTYRRPAPGGRVFSSETTLFLCGTFAMRRELFLDVGGYGEQLEYSENTDLRLRLAPLLSAGTVRTAHSPKVLLRVYERTNRYDPQVRFDSAAAILERNYEQLAKEPRLLALYQSIVGVAASKLGRHGVAVQSLAAAVRTEPMQPRHSLRLARAMAIAARRSVAGGISRWR